MKFKNPSLNFFLNGRTEGHTHGWTNQYDPHFFKVGGIKTKHYANTPMLYTVIFHGCKNDNF